MTKMTKYKLRLIFRSGAKVNAEVESAAEDFIKTAEHDHETGEKWVLSDPAAESFVVSINMADVSYLELTKIDQTKKDGD